MNDAQLQAFMSVLLAQARALSHQSTALKACMRRSTCGNACCAHSHRDTTRSAPREDALGIHRDDNVADMSEDGKRELRSAMDIDDFLAIGSSEDGEYRPRPPPCRTDEEKSTPLATRLKLRRKTRVPRALRGVAEPRRKTRVVQVIIPRTVESEEDPGGDTTETAESAAHSEAEHPQEHVGAPLSHESKYGFVYSGDGKCACGGSWNPGTMTATTLERHLRTNRHKIWASARQLAAEAGD